jgi:hypothetical protein
MFSANTGGNCRKGLGRPVVRNRFQEGTNDSRKEDGMGLVVLLLLLALLFGGVGLAAGALWWMLIIAGALVIASLFTGFGRRSTW